MTQQVEKQKTTLKPLGNRVVTERLEEKESYKGGIIIPDSAKKKQEMARVIAVGPGNKNDEGKFIEIPIKVGDVVLIDKYSGQEVNIDDEEYIIVKADDVIAIIEE